MPLKIYDDKDIEDIYELNLDEDKPTEGVAERLEEVVEEKPEPREIVLPSMRAVARGDVEEVESLKRKSPEIFGSLFDRVDFLKQRIDEIEGMIKEREGMHKEMVEDIDADILEKNDMQAKALDINEKRNFKLDISLLRKEKRAETRQFWRDVMELRTELGELNEQFQTENKIAGIFSDMGGKKE